mgnify:CR=1 FL=1
MQLSRIDWPAIIARDGDDELTFVASEESWVNDPGISAVQYWEDDVLIDRTGRRYHLDKMEAGITRPYPADRRLSLDELLGLIKRHAAASNTCCVDKIGFRNIDEGMAIVASLVDD